MATLTASDLDRAGIRLQPEVFERLALEVVKQLPTASATDRRHDVMASDAAALIRGGFDLAALPPDVEDPLARTAAEYSALVVTGISVAQAARRLGVHASRVRQRLAKRTLYGIKLWTGSRLPAFQFDDQHDGHVIPGIDQVVSVLDPALHPVAVYRWFTLPHPDLAIYDRAVSPRDWLRSGGKPGEAAALAACL